jgi:RimJ/RimL family protein N-acetyltransferase
MLITGDYREHMAALGFHLSDRATFLGEAIDGQIVGLIAFDNYNGTNIDIHIAATRITRRLLKAAAQYAFDVCGVRRITSLNDSENFQMGPYLERLGFKYEGTMRHGLPDSDLIVYGLIREDCKWVSPKPAA